jgi:hypothetical protein
MQFQIVAPTIAEKRDETQENEKSYERKMGVVMSPSGEKR